MFNFCMEFRFQSALAEYFSCRFPRKYIHKHGLLPGPGNIQRWLGCAPLKLFQQEISMKGLTIVGVLLLVLGALSFVIPIPHSEDHSVKLGDAKIGVQTHSSDKVPPAVSI